MRPHTPDVIISDKLRQCLQAQGILNDPEMMEKVKKGIKYYVDQFKESAIDPVAFTRAYYELLDTEIAKVNLSEVTCKKGCSHCCHINVSITDLEMKTIADYCMKKGIKVSKSYLKEQLKYTWKEIPLIKNSACVFLKNGECSIYKVRPTACRTYFVTSLPEKCNHKRYLPPSYEVRLVHLLFVEFIVSAMDQFVSKTDRLPLMLMPYAH